MLESRGRTRSKTCGKNVGYWLCCKPVTTIVWVALLRRAAAVESGVRARVRARTHMRTVIPGYPRVHAYMHDYLVTCALLITSAACIQGLCVFLYRQLIVQSSFWDGVRMVLWSRDRARPGDQSSDLSGSVSEPRSSPLLTSRVPAATLF